MLGFVDFCYVINNIKRTSSFVLTAGLVMSGDEFSSDDQHLTPCLSFFAQTCIVYFCLHRWETQQHHPDLTSKHTGSSISVSDDTSHRERKCACVFLYR